MFKFFSKSFFLLFYAFFLPFCQPIHYYSSILEENKHLNHNLRIPISIEKIHARIGEKIYQEFFMSNKLDLVFILDTNPDIKEIYKINLFGKNFLQKFQDYDWRFAYTDMSFNIPEFQKTPKEIESEETEKSDPSSCTLFNSLILTAGGLFVESPILTYMGFNNLLYCFSKLKKKSDKEDQAIFTNGKFLPFEYYGKKWNDDWFLDKSNKYFNKLFDHTMRYGNEQDSKATYQAPEIRKSPSYPFLSMSLSMAKYAETQNEKSFFRKDSLIVYILVTNTDFKNKIPAEDFKESLKSFFGSDKRIKIIPIQIINSSLCTARFGIKNTSQKSPKKMNRFITELHSQSRLDLCSYNLAEELATEIKKNLYPKGFLND